MQKLLRCIFLKKIRWKGERKKPLDFGGKSDHVMLWLGLWLDTTLGLTLTILLR